MTFSREVRMPFKRSFHPKLADGTKTCTSRTRKVGDPGDTFSVPLAGGNIIRLHLVINAVEQRSLAYIRDHLYQEEGCDSPEAFVRVWLGIYHKFEADRMLWVHHFERV